MDQISLFDMLSSKQDEDIICEIIPKFRKYGIDNLYKKKFNSTKYSYTFYEIEETLMKCKTYKTYINELFKELTKYYEVTQKAYLIKTKTPKIEFRGDCITLATYRCVGPIFCIEMLKDRLEGAKDV